MRAFRFHVDQSCWFSQTPLRTQKDPLAVIRSAVCHKVALGTADFVPGKVCGREDFDFGNDDCFVMCRDGVGRGIGDLVGSNEEGIRRGVKDAGFVEVGSAGVIDEKLELWIGAEEREEGVMVD